MTLVRQTLLRIGLAAALALCIVLGGGLPAVGSSASAQDVQVSGPLAGAPAVRELRLWREMRLQVEPFFAFTIGDAYTRSLIVGGEARFHFLDWLGIGGWGGYSVAQLDTNLSQQIQAKGVTTNANRLDLPSREAFAQQTGKLNWWSGVEAHFTPFRGKLALFQKIFVDADLDLFVGAAFVGVQERADAVGLNAAGNPSAGNVTQCEIVGISGSDPGCLQSQSTSSKRLAVAPSFGVAFTAYFREFMGIALRWRGIPFKYNIGGTDVNNDGTIDSADRQRQFNNMFSVGFIFVLPPKIKTTD